MSILLWITIEMEYIIKCLKFILFFTNGHQKLDPERVKQLKIIETRKEKWDRTARERTFAENDLVLLRAPGLLSKLEDAGTGHGK